MKRVVVTGLGAITPIGNTVEAYWEGLVSGKSGAAPITRFNAERFRTHFACEVKNFVPEKFIPKKEVRKLDLFAQFAMVSADEAVKDAGLLTAANLNLDRIGVIVGSGVGGLTTVEQEVEAFAKGDGTPRHSPFLTPKQIIDIAPGHISIKYGYRGINYATVSACASASHAIINAFDYIRLGKADIIVAGGAEAPMSKTGLGGFNALKALSTRNDDPITASRPFDANRDGFVLGEGAGMLIMEEYEHAKARGAKIYAEVVGTGMTADAYHITAPHPEGISVANVMRLALEEAGLRTSEIDYINVHGTSTELGDLAELKAIQKVFGEDAYRLNISSTKSMTGHLLGGAGAIEAIASILAIQHDLVPPTINNFTRDPLIDPNLNLTLNEAQPRIINAAMSNTFGFGGHNTSIIFKKFA